jgi:hypothetical protein
MRGSVKRDSGKSAEHKAQSKAFEDAARSLECDESEERFDAALRKIAAHKPSLQQSARQESCEEQCNFSTARPNGT